MPPGVPDILYRLPQMSGHRDMKKDISPAQLNATVSVTPNLLPEGKCAMDDKNEELFKYFNYVVSQKNLPYPPSSWLEAKKVFIEIATLI